MFGWLRSRAGELWLRDVGERTGWTFVEVFAAAFGMTGLYALGSGHFPLGLARTAALAGLTAAAVVVKGAIVAKVKGGGLSPASSASPPDPEPPSGTDPGWDAPAPADATVPPVPRTSDGENDQGTTWDLPPAVATLGRPNTAAQNAARAQRAAREGAEKRAKAKAASRSRKR